MEILSIDTKKKYNVIFKDSSTSSIFIAEGELINDDDFVRIGDSYFAKSEILAIVRLKPELTGEPDNEKNTRNED